jgi:hypothetical protein
MYGIFTGVFSREITKNTVIYGVYIRFWPALGMYQCPKGKWETEGARKRRETGRRKWERKHKNVRKTASSGFQNSPH